MKRLALSLAALLAGCASPGPAPLSADHPASPNGAEAATPAVATALDASPTPALEPTAPAAAHAHDHAAPPSTAAGSPEVMYACPHHPEVVSDQPGTCPKCGGMKLEPVTRPTSRPATQPAGGGGGAHDHAGHGGGQ